MLHVTARFGCHIPTLSHRRSRLSDHYQPAPGVDGVECIDAIESALTPEEFAGFLKGCAMKYLWREQRKGDAAGDVMKARWYLARLQMLRENQP